MRHLFNILLFCSCELCGKQLKSRNCYKTHMRNTHADLEERKHACNLCSARFLMPSALKNHIINRHSEKLFGCELCDKRFVFSRIVFEKKPLILFSLVLPRVRAWRCMSNPYTTTSFHTSVISAVANSSRNHRSNSMSPSIRAFTKSRHNARYAANGCAAITA